LTSDVATDRGPCPLPAIGGFPGSVISEIKYSLLSGGIWDLNLYSKPSSRTPLLLSSHVYWNFDVNLLLLSSLPRERPLTSSVPHIQGYSVMNSTAKDWVLHMPYAEKVVATDPILIPTGEFTNVTGTAYDFTQPHPIGYAWNETLGFSGVRLETLFPQSPSTRHDVLVY
jgi:aldose 1-epimerase